ncbi:MAG: cell division protein FtsH [Alphaproteobacteria bacterium]|nr:cell division protein FtsH [Alphaproteobacteria bacterium]|tara:strand:- start:27395 stop:29308 length:1914 start_codon:yes stop_codon:yes gene_type:complete
MSRNILFWLGVAVAMVFAVQMMQGGQMAQMGSNEKISYSEFMQAAQEGRVDEVIIKGQKLYGTYGDSSSFNAMVPPNENVVDRLQGANIQIFAEEEDPEKISILGIIISLLPAILIIGVWIFFMRQMQGKGGGGAMGFGKSRAKMLNESTTPVTFEDVAGIDEARQELEEIVDFLKDPGKFEKLGGKIPKGALLVGPPGTGKTLVARAVAGEAGVPFFSISGSDFVEMFVGVGASRVRDMFEQGKKNAPCIIFIDEIDAVGRHRGAGFGGGNDEREQTLNQMLVEMDGFAANDGVIILAATNRPDVLDPALLRPGRFDRQIPMPLPDVKGREKILSVHLKKIAVASHVDASTIARGTPGFSGAELANLVNEAALLAARKNKLLVGNEELEEAKDKVMMGSERRSLAMSEEEKKLTAYHEAGHAIVALAEPESDPIHKATIVPRGQALGMVMRLPEGDRYSQPKARMKANLSVAMGGRVAEEIIFGEDFVTSGASGDIKQATSLARAMVTQWGLSDKVGMIDYGENEGGYQPKRISSATEAIIEDEVRSLVDEGYTKAKKVLTDQLEDLHTLAKALLEYELLSGDEIKAVLNGEKIVRNTDDDEGGATSPKTSVPTSVPKATKKKDKGDDFGGEPQGV